MSTCLNCEIVERKPGEWYYVLEDGSAPKEAWDWRDFATAYGSFESYEKAGKHLDDNHPNPGGHSVVRHAEYREDEVYGKLFEDAGRRFREEVRAAARRYYRY